MAQTPRELTPMASSRYFFGAELRHWRGQRHLSQDELGIRVHASGDLIGKIEKAVRWPPEEITVRCDAVLETGGILTRLWSLVDRERRIVAAMTNRWHSLPIIWNRLIADDDDTIAPPSEAFPAVDVGGAFIVVLLDGDDDARR